MSKLYFSPTLKVACIGEAMIELALDPSNSRRASISFAGDVLNTAIYFNMEMGSEAEVEFVSAVGVDHLSDKMISFIQSHGVSTSFCSRIDDRIPGLYMITTDNLGERSFSYWRSEAAARLMFQAEGTALFDKLEQFDLIYFSGISLAILPDATRGYFLDWLGEFGNLSGKRIAFDSNFRPKLWNSHDEAKFWIERAWNVTDIALPSLDDELLLYGENSEVEILGRFKKYGIKLGALKRGASGAVAIDGSGCSNTLGKAKSVVDTTAAGDSFNAAFLASILKNNDIQRAIVDGHNRAIQVIGYHGAIMGE